MNLIKLINETQLLKDSLSNIYVDAPSQFKRYCDSLYRFKELFEDNEIIICSTPGRIELCGNHTDHQFGKILAAAIDIDSIAIASKADKICIYSEGFSRIEINMDNDQYLESEKYTTTSLIKGIIKRFKELKLNCGGFNAYITSNVMTGSGMSSSANFEVLVATIINHLYNDGTIDAITIAKISQYSEVNYFGKPCGLMDQLACVYGGIIYVDFKEKEKPKVIKVDDIFNKHDFILSLVHTRSSHNDLSDEYAKIVDEMKMVAQYFSQPSLSKVEDENFYDNILNLDVLKNDRAILRAHHYFSEIKRVNKLYEAIINDDIDLILNIIKQSGYSSFMYLQNIYLSSNTKDQKMSLALAMIEYCLFDYPSAFRVHGGGFGGTILAIFHKNENTVFQSFIKKEFEENACQTTNIRNSGSICVLK